MCSPYVIKAALLWKIKLFYWAEACSGSQELNRGTQTCSRVHLSKQTYWSSVKRTVDSSLVLRLSNLSQLHSSYDVFSGHYVNCILLFCSFFFRLKVFKTMWWWCCSPLLWCFYGRKEGICVCSGLWYESSWDVGPVQRVQRLMK